MTPMTSRLSSRRLHGAGVWQWYPVPESEGSRPETKLDNTPMPMAAMENGHGKHLLMPKHRSLSGLFLLHFFLDFFLGSWKYILENGGRCSPSTVY